MNQYLTMKELKDALPEIPENSLKRYLQEHQEYLDFKKEHNRYSVRASEIETLLLIRKLYADGLKKEEVNAKLEENGIPLTITFDPNENQSLVSVNHELTDMKKLVSFLVQQNEQSRIHQNKLKEQNQELISEVQELRNTVEEMMEVQHIERERENERIASIIESFSAAQRTIEEIATSFESRRDNWIWQKVQMLFRK